MQTEEYARLFELEDRYWWFVARRRIALGLLSRYAWNNGKVLDVGCGTGAVLKELSSHGIAFGVDLSPLALGFCRQRELGELVQGDAAKLPFKEGVFDAIVALDTVEHVPDHESAIREICRVLKPGGVLVLNVPAFSWLWGPHDVALMHCRRYTRPQVRKLLEDQGLTPVKMSYSVFFLFPIVFVIRGLEKFHRGPAKASLPPVPRWMNSLLCGLMGLESALLERVALPWGSSVVAVARKAE